jgi:uncharacterized protein
MSKDKAADVDEYIARSALEARPTLIELRELIVSTVPEAEERISYGVPFYRYHGDLAGFAAYKNHVSFGFGADVLRSDDRKTLEAAGYTLGKVTLQINFDQPVPARAIKRLLRARARMNTPSQA